MVVQQDPRLELAAQRHFGSWQDAVEAAGFRLTGLQRWDKERILEEIRALHRRGVRLSWSRAPVALRLATRLYFGGWRLAIESAGLKPVRLVRSNEEIMALLRKGARSGRIGVGPNGFVDWPIYDLARRRFGSFPAALKAAGLDPAKLLWAVPVHYRTDESVAAELRRLARERPDMTLGELHQTNVAGPVKRRYGSLLAAVEALGIAGWPRRGAAPPIAPEEVLSGIWSRHRRGEPMRATLALASEPRLTMGAYRCFGSWRAAMRAAGLGAFVDDGPWNRGSIRAELKGRRLRRERLTLQAIEHDDPSLGAAIRQRYDSFAQALRDMARPARPRRQAAGSSEDAAARSP